MDKCGFVYVENLVWVKQEVNNTLVTQPYKYFRRSKTSLLIFRTVSCSSLQQKVTEMKGEGNGLELRHQRNPDVVFDFVREDKGEFYHCSQQLMDIQD